MSVHLTRYVSKKATLETYQTVEVAFDVENHNPQPPALIGFRLYEKVWVSQEKTNGSVRSLSSSPKKLGDAQALRPGH